MEMQIPRSSRVKFITTYSYSRLNDFITSRKNDPKLSTLISTSSSVSKVDLRNSAPSDFVPQQQGMNERTKNTSYDHSITVSHVQPSFKDLDSPKDDPITIVDDTDEDEIHATTNDETEETLVPKSSSLKSSQIQELTTLVLILQSQKYKLELEKNKAKAALLKAQPLFPNDAEKESTDSDSDDDTQVTGSVVEPSKTKKLKKFDFVTENGEHVHLTEEHISAQKKIEEDAKAEAARLEDEMRNEELIDLLGPEVVNKYYNDKLQEDDTSEIILEFKASDLNIGEWREVVTACPNKKSKGWTFIYKRIQEIIDYLYTTQAKLGINLDRPLSEQDPLDRLNDLANKKRKHADDIIDFFRANKRLKSSV
nr:hypothetical protein [Tanacetum cinerariifolium]GEW57730.1 hypothetical protein [Tanacetum cinerariifolium]